ncbi:zinc finger protein 714, partial [Asbolus verrucosus]
TAVVVKIFQQKLGKMEIDLTSKCRVCLCGDEEMHYLFNEFDQGISLQDILTSTTRFEVDKDDGFSPYLCQNCTTIIVDFYNLKTVYKENENQIKALLSNSENSSNENMKTTETPSEGLDGLQNVELNNIAQEKISSDDDDYITIKVESVHGSDDEEYSFDGEFAPKQEINDYMEPNQFGFTQEEADNFSPDDKNTPMLYEYQQINTYTCPECGDCFLYKDDIQEHMASKHDIFELNYEELSEMSLVKVKKIDDKAFCANKCKICHQPFQTIEAYKDHLETHKKNVCDVCGVGFVKKSYLKDHQEIHCPEKRHVCSYCNKAFKRRTVLVKHKRIHTHPRECICEVCGKAFNDKGTLKTHIMLLHVKERNYMCLICGVKFPLKATLEKHIRRHQNKEREFFCTQCPLGYRDKSSLDRHIYVKHSGQNVKSTCGECGKQYTTISSLLKHQRVSHGAPAETEEMATGN